MKSPRLQRAPFAYTYVHTKDLATLGTKNCGSSPHMHPNRHYMQVHTLCTMYTYIGTDIPVFGKDRIIQNDLLKQFDEFTGKVGIHEGLHSDRHFIGVLGLTEGSLHHLVHQRPQVRLICENLGPQFGILATNQVACFRLEQTVFVANLMTTRGDETVPCYRRYRTVCKS